MPAKATALILLLSGCAALKPVPYDDLRKLEDQQAAYEFYIKCQEARSEQRTTSGTMIYVRHKGHLLQCRN